MLFRNMIFGIFASAFLMIVPFVSANAALDLTESVSVEKTAETAAAAKSDAMSQARRDIFNAVLSRYADAAVIREASQNISGGEIENLVSSVVIDNEKTSRESYSATIKMTFDLDATRKWMAANDIPNVMDAVDDSANRTIVFMEMDDGLSDWMNFVVALRDANAWDGLDLSVKSIFGKNVTASISTSARNGFISAVRQMGWAVSDSDGILRINK